MHNAANSIFYSVDPCMKQRIFLYLFSLPLLFPLVYVFGADIMEARNFILAQSMAQDGNRFILDLFTEIRLDKPPLPVWLTIPFFMIDVSPLSFGVACSRHFGDSASWRILLRPAQAPVWRKQSKSLCRNCGCLNADDHKTENCQFLGYILRGVHVRESCCSVAKGQGMDSHWRT